MAARIITFELLFRHCTKGYTRGQELKQNSAMGGHNEKVKKFAAAIKLFQRLTRRSREQPEIQKFT
jgi:hypothetical protein